jgi:hypothetical protein
MVTSTSTHKWVLPALMLLALIAGCGDDSDSEPPDPEIPAAVAGPLAELSDQAADQLAAGDACGAKETVDELEHQVELSQTQVPRQLRAELEAGVQKLAARIECVPLAPVTEEPEPEPEPEPKPKPEEKPDKKPEEKAEENQDCPPGQEKMGGSDAAFCAAEGGDGNSGQGNGGEEGEE